MGVGGGGGGGAAAEEPDSLGLLFDCPSAAGSIWPETLPDLHFDFDLTLEDFSTAPAFGEPSLADLGLDCLPLIRENEG